MNNFKKKFNFNKEKFSGNIKEATGKIIGNEQLELKGKIQSLKADFKKSVRTNKKINDIKENIAKKINDKIDEKKEE